MEASERPSRRKDAPAGETGRSECPRRASVGSGSASQLAEACGYRLAVTGDCFVARVFDDENDFRRIDFLESELDSGAAWVAEARAYHASHPAAQPGAETMMAHGGRQPAAVRAHPPRLASQTPA